MTNGIVYFFIFIFGAIIGSFLNVVILRHNTGAGFVRRSFCFSCGKKLSWRELIPIASFVFQKGRCRECGGKISWQYPIVEFLSGLLFIAVFWKIGVPASAGNTIFNFLFFDPELNVEGQFSIFNVASLFYYFLTFSLLLVIAVYDIRHKIIPDQFVYIFIALAFLNVFEIWSASWQMEFGIWFAAGPLLALPLALFWFVSGGRWMGFGDAKLMIGIGWLLGLEKGIVSLLISFWAGAIFSVVFLAAGRFTRLSQGGKSPTIKSEIPFAPFLIAGALTVFLFDISFYNIELLFSIF